MASVEDVRLSLVGRDCELTLLEDLVRRAGVEGGSIVVRGDAGIGKSALVAEASRLAHERLRDN
jgi:predicted ATPase